MKYALAPLAAMVLLAACSQAPPPPPDTRADDAKAIRAVETAWNQAWASKDLDKTASFWADDATVMIPGMKAMKGNASVKAGLKEMKLFEDPNLALTFMSDTVEVAKSGDIGYAQGTYSMTSTDAKSKKAIVETGSFVTIYKKQAGGSWKAVEDINAADGPPTAAPDAKK